MTTGDLNQLLPAAKECKVGGETLSILPLKVGKLPAFLRAITPALRYIAQNEIDWLALFAEEGEALLNAVAIAVGRDRAWVDELTPDEVIVLASTVVEVNSDFFTRTVLPRLKDLFGQVSAVTDAVDGLTPSSG